MLAGTIEYELAGRETVTLCAGDAFFECRDHRVGRFDDASPDERAVVIACYPLPDGVDDVIEPLPGSC